LRSEVNNTTKRRVGQWIWWVLVYIWNADCRLQETTLF
jgi:hypothetical protein